MQGIYKALQKHKLIEIRYTAQGIRISDLTFVFEERGLIFSQRVGSLGAEQKNCNLRLSPSQFALFGLCVNGSLLVHLRQHIRVKRFMPMVLGGFVGLPLGVLFLHRADSQTVKLVLGVVILLYVVWSVLDRSLSQREAGSIWGAIAGAAGGALGGAFNTGGPPAIMYLATQKWSPESIKANLQIYFFIGSIIQLSLYGYYGLLTIDILILDAKLLPAVLIGVWGGATLSKHVNRALFQKIVLGALFLLGILFVIRSQS